MPYRVPYRVYILFKVTDIAEITGFGVMMTPALAVDNEVIFAGKVPCLVEMKRILDKLR